LNDVLDGIRSATGINAKDETILRFISEDINKYMLEADVAKKRAAQALDTIKRASISRQKNAFQKTTEFFTRGVNDALRGMQAGLDLAAPFIQGRKGIGVNPAGWFKAYVPMIKAIGTPRAEEYALKHIAKIESHPLYSRALAAGFELSEAGNLTRQEEQFAGNWRKWLLSMENEPNKIKRGALMPIETYVNALVRSEDAFSVYLNDLRWDTFVKMAKADPNNPEYLKDVANIVNIIYGRGTGRIANAMSNFGGGVGFFAPKYLYSNLQYQTLQPLLGAKTVKGALNAGKVYATHAAVTSGLIPVLAGLAGWKYNTDLRDNKFGHLSNGEWDIDVIGKDTQFLRLGAQLAYGKVNKDGDLAYPNAVQTAKLIGQFALNKTSPVTRLAVEKSFGVYDEKYDESRPMEGKDVLTKLLPIWVQQKIQNEYKLEKDPRKAMLNSFALLSMLGFEINPNDSYWVTELEKIAKNPRLKQPIYWTAPGSGQIDVMPPRVKQPTQTPPK
jgi:hypothetical protein